MKTSIIATALTTALNLANKAAITCLPFGAGFTIDFVDDIATVTSDKTTKEVWFIENTFSRHAEVSFTNVTKESLTALAIDLLINRDNTLSMIEELPLLSMFEQFTLEQLFLYCTIGAYKTKQAPPKVGIFNGIAYDMLAKTPVNPGVYAELSAKHDNSNIMFALQVATGTVELTKRNTSTGSSVSLDFTAPIFSNIRDYLESKGIDLNDIDFEHTVTRESIVYFSLSGATTDIDSLITGKQVTIPGYDLKDLNRTKRFSIIKLAVKL